MTLSCSWDPRPGRQGRGKRGLCVSPSASASVFVGGINKTQKTQFKAEKPAEKKEGEREKGGSYLSTLSSGLPFFRNLRALVR